MPTPRQRTTARSKATASPTSKAADPALQSANDALGRTTRQRRLLLSILAREQRPLSPYELHELAVRELPSLGLSTVYRTLRALDEAEEICAVDVPGQTPRYELAEAAAHHHHHFHCRACDRVYELKGCPGGIRQLLPRGFTLEDHTIVLTGRCDRCAN